MLPHAAGPPATSSKIGCQAGTLGLVPATGSTPQLWVFCDDPGA
jgi:hypothetical protein